MRSRGRGPRCGAAAAPALLEAVSKDVRFAAAARRSIEEGNVLPERLDGRRGVGAPQSLAGARSHDDVIVRLEEVDQEAGPDGGLSLRIGRPLTCRGDH